MVENCKRIQIFAIFNAIGLEAIAWAVESKPLLSVETHTEIFSADGCLVFT